MAVIAFLVATVAAAAAPGTNAERMARGLPPKAPRKLYRKDPTPASPARRSTPSGSPSSCSTGPVQCCNTLTTASDPLASVILGLLGIILGPDVAVGLTCSPISVIGVGGGSCSANTVCCENNNVGGLISIGCIPIIL
ncbi:fungal hydrophobin-domain-containing protein [Dichomitus squalens]|nr:fungal hydrophobin-domain-containing protein [Dichomitus squalens]